MKNMRLNCENWLNGEIELKETYKNEIPEKGSKEYSIFENCQVSKDSFGADELGKINQHQKKYFAQLSDEFYNKLHSDFKKRYDSAKNPVIVLEEELFRLDQIINGKWSESVLKEYTNEFTQLTMPKDSFMNFSNYIQKIKKREFEPYFDFVPSPKSKYFNPNSSIIPEIYASVMFQLKENLSRHHPTPDQISRVPKELLIEPANPRPDIFSNGWAYKAFIIMQETVAVNPNSHHADYALIYHCLHFPEIQGIWATIDKKTFVDFVNQRLKGETILSVSNMRRSTSVDKNMTIRYALKHYLKRIGYSGDVQRLLKKVTKEPT